MRLRRRPPLQRPPKTYFTGYVHKILGTTYTYEGSERIHIQANVFLKPA